ncbi:MAG TPA: heme-binding protein [Xanthobacteraceae bacterium]|nr:heme-binding protein [Xanthobacteraceae bacterium]
MSVLNSAAKSAIPFAAVPLALMLAAPAQAQLITHKDLSYAMALTIATGALDDCKAKGYAVSVVVVDRDGINMVALRADGAGPHTMENARRKAYTALTFKMTTEAFAKALETNPARRPQTTLPGVISIPGGVPVKVGDEVIAGVGLSGSPGVDEPCVRAGLAKVEDQLK